MSEGRGRRFASGALVAAPAALLTTAAVMRAARGPSWLAYNFDPTYAYLLNSLIILKGYRPYLIHHPGVPLQALGSVVMAGVHAASGSGPLAADVIARPEQFILWIHWAALVAAAALIAASGIIVRRRAGLAAALLVQSGPWLSITAASLLGHLRAEVLIAGTATLWTAYLVAYAIRPEASTPARLGAATGVTLALHMSALPLLVGPLLLAERWAERRRFAIWTGAAFLVAFAPAWLKLPSFAKVMLNISLHSGSYGEGSATIVDAASYLSAIPRLVAAEPAASAIVAIGAAIWIAWTFGDRASDAAAHRGLARWWRPRSRASC